MFAGASPGSLVPITTGADYGEANFYALAGTAYQIEVATPSESEQYFTLSLYGPVPPTMNPTNAVRLRDGGYDIHIVGSVGQSFVIQVSTNLRDWTTILTDTLLASSMDYIDTSARPSPRYYRVLPLDTALNNQPFSMLAPSAAASGGFSLSLTGVSGQPFQILSSTNLTDWYDLTSGVLMDNTFNFTDYDAPQFPCRFYRAVAQ